MVPEVCTMVTSQGADEKYGFLGAMPGMKEWLGDRQFQTLRAADYTLANKEYESSVNIDKNDIDDDRLGMYGPVLQQLGMEAAHHPDELLLTLITAGESTACFDGQYFFDTDHSWGDSGSQSNDLTYAAASGTTPTEDEFRSAYHAARKAMLQFKNDQGKLFIRPTVRPLPNLLLVVPPDLEEVANKAINKQLVSSGETNIVLDKPRIVRLGGIGQVAAAIRDLDAVARGDAADTERLASDGATWARTNAKSTCAWMARRGWSARTRWSR